MKRILAAYHKVNDDWSTPRGFFQKFIDRGFEVIDLSWTEYEPLHLSNKIDKINKKDSTDVLIIFSSGLNINLDIDIINIRKNYKNIIIVTELGDEPQTVYDNGVKAVFSHLSFTPDKECYSFWKSLGLNCIWLTHWADDSIFYDQNKNKKTQIKTTAVGRKYTKLLSIIFKNKFIARHVWGAENTNFYNTALITFQYARWGEITRRIFEAGATGSCVVTNRLDKAKGLNDIFEENKSIIYYSNFIDLVFKLTYLLINKNKAKNIGLAASKIIAERCSLNVAIDLLIANIKKININIIDDININKKIKILFYVENPFSLGGSQKYKLNLIKKLPKNIFECYLLTPVEQLNSALSWVRNNNVNLNVVEYAPIRIISVSNIARLTFGGGIKNKVLAISPDLIFTSSGGVPEIPLHSAGFNFIDTNHINGGVNKLPTLVRSLLISNESLVKWINLGGNVKKSARINSILDPLYNEFNEFGIKVLKVKGDKFAFGFHQRASDQIFSDIPLQAYKLIETDKTCFLILGGSSLYSEQAKLLKIKNFYQFPPNINYEIVENFLRALDVYAHGRFCGELWPATIAEAMRLSIPVVTHKGKYNNGQLEMIGNPHFFVDGVHSYAERLHELLHDSKLRKNYGVYLHNRIVTLYDENISTYEHISYLLSSGMKARIDSYLNKGRGYKIFKRLIKILILYYYKYKIYIFGLYFLAKITIRNSVKKTLIELNIINDKSKINNNN